MGGVRPHADADGCYTSPLPCPAHPAGLLYVDRVLYLVDGRFRIGTVEEVMTSETLSALYRADIEVARIGGQYVVVGQDGAGVDNSEHASGHCCE